MVRLSFSKSLKKHKNELQNIGQNYKNLQLIALGDHFVQLLIQEHTVECPPKTE